MCLRSRYDVKYSLYNLLHVMWHGSKISQRWWHRRLVTCDLRRHNCGNENERITCNMYCVQMKNAIDSCGWKIPSILVNIRSRIEDKNSWIWRRTIKYTQLQIYALEDILDGEMISTNVRDEKTKTTLFCATGTTTRVYTQNTTRGHAISDYHWFLLL